MEHKSVFNVLVLILAMRTPALQSQPPETVPYVDLERYAGKWYEIAAYPQRFQKGCHGTTAEYTLSTKGFLIVENRCNRGGIDGKESYIRGKAFVEKNSGNAKLRVRFFWPFSGKYWIIDLADDYRYAVVSDPSKKYLWILARTPLMDDADFSGVRERLEAKGFELSRIVKTVHR
jgi:apolipoprotein D and lipocalin family protein